MELATLYERLGDLYAERASKGRNHSNKQQEQWREAERRYTRSLGVWVELNNQDKLAAADKSKPDDISRKLARCKAAVNKFSKLDDSGAATP